MATEHEPRQDRASAERVAGVAPLRAPEHALLQLQRSAGNAAVARLLAARANQLQRVRLPDDLKEAEKKHNDARAALDQDRDRLIDALAQGKGKHDDPVLQNSIDWIQKQPLNVKLYAVRETGDSAERAQVNKRSGMAAFFPPASAQDESGDITAGLPTYEWGDLEDNRGVHFDTPTTGGWNVGGRLIAIRVGASREDIWRSLKHEVQHSADRHHEAYRRLDKALPPSYRRGDEMLITLADILRRRGTKLGGDLPDTAPLTEMLPDLNVSDLQYEWLEGSHEGGVVKPSPIEIHGPVETELGKAFLEASAQLDVAAKLMEPQVFMAQMAFEQYKTEFRAYWYMGNPEFDKLQKDLGAPSTIFGGVFSGFAKKLDVMTGVKDDEGRWWTLRQHAIMEHICDGYPSIGEHYEKNSRLLDGRTFRQAVHAYQLPDTHGMNKLNSVRVNAFYDALMSVPEGTNDAAHPKVAAVLVAGSALRPAEAEYLREPDQAAAINRLMQKQLTGAALTAVSEQLRKQ